MAKERTVQELYDEAVKYCVQDEPIDEVESFLCAPKARGVCGCCKHRKTQKCPWPQSSRLTDPICLDFEPRGAELTNQLQTLND